jgi:hypothetical protein
MSISQMKNDQLFVHGSELFFFHYHKGMKRLTLVGNVNLKGEVTSFNLILVANPSNCINPGAVGSPVKVVLSKELKTPHMHPLLQFDQIYLCGPSVIYGCKKVGAVTDDGEYRVAQKAGTLGDTYYKAAFKCITL